MNFRYLFLTTAALVVILFASCGPQTKSCQFIFFNSSDKTLELIIERNGKNETREKVPAHSNTFAYVTVGKVDIKAFDGDTCVMLHNNYEVTADSTNGYTCLDMKGTTQYVMVQTAYLYEAGSSLAQEIINASGVKGSGIVGDMLDGDKGFCVEFAPNWPYEKLPSKISASSAGYALVPIYKSFEMNEELYEYIDTYLKRLGTK